MIIRKTLLALAATVLSLGVAQASIVSYNFQGVIEETTGTPSLVGEAFSGQFSYDDVTLELASLNFSFLGESYTLGQATPVSFVSVDAGQAIGVDAFYDGAARLILTSGFGAPYLTYISATDVESFGSYAVSAVPEPTALSLSVLGLAALGLASRRRRHTVAAATA